MTTFYTYLKLGRSGSIIPRPNRRGEPSRRVTSYPWGLSSVPWLFCSCVLRLTAARQESPVIRCETLPGLAAAPRRAPDWLEAKISKGRTSAKIILKARILLKADQSEEGQAGRMKKYARRSIPTLQW